MVRPMLGDLDLEQVQLVETDEDQVTIHHPVPALDAGFLQRLGRRGARLRLTGVLTRPDTLATLTDLRARFHAAAPVPFVSDITTATLVEQVLVEGMEVRELAGRPARLEYSFTLREYTEAQPVTPEPIDIPPPTPPDVSSGALSVTVVVEGRPTFDFSRVTVHVRGTEDEGARPLDRFLTDRVSDDVWVEDPFPAGSYTVEARVAGEAALTGSATTRVENGEVAQVRLVLRAGARIGTVHVVHFRFDSAFVEPCMRAVLRRVADHAAAHPDERLLLVGHTDLVGSDAYNQSLSERRARAAYAALTYGRDPIAAVNEWNELRRARPAGVLPSARDTWGAREYQHMLADLGYFRGNVGGDFDLTDAAVRRFQADNGLTDDGIVGDATWPMLIDAYLAQAALAVPDAQLLANAADGCDEGPLRWLGCSEQDPVLRTQDAWRPNRRAELMFVTEAQMPCPVPRPVTLDLVPDGAGGGGWCLDDGTASAVCCFVTPADAPCPDGPSERWCRRPAEEDSFTVQGRVMLDDGTPVADAKYVLAAPDGEFLDGEVKVSSGAARAGTPLPGRTGADGAFRYDKQKGPGIYTFELEGPFVARLEGQPLAEAKGNTVCARLDGGGGLVVVATPRAAVMVSPAITAPDAVVVRKPHTTPARRPVTLRASEAFTGTGTLTRSDDRVRLFTAAAGGTELAFDGVDNVFSDAQLAAGHTLFAEGARPSDAVHDVTLTLALTVAGTPGLSTSATMTAVELTLDVGLSRTAPGVDPPLLPEADKGDPGRFVQAADPGFSHERAMLVVRPPRPAGFAGDLAVAPLSGRLALWENEIPAAGQAPVATPRVVPSASIPADGLRLFVDGTGPSAATRDTGIQLGLDGVEPDGDRVQATVVQLDASREGSDPAPPVTVARLGVWDNAYDAAGDVRNEEAEADNFVGADARRLHFRVRDVAKAGAPARLDWKTLRADRTDDDVPASLRLTLPETAAGSGVFVSRGVMLVTDDTDRDQATHSGLAAPDPDAGVRDRGQSNHRLRRAGLDGLVRAEYAPQPGVRLPLVLPVFPRDPDERRRLPVRVIRYTNPGDPRFRPATDAYIAAEFARANDRWRQVGLLVEPAATVDRPVPAGAIDPATGQYPGAVNNPQEQAALADLIPITPDDTLTVVFVHRAVGDNGYATVADRDPVPLPAGGTVTLGDRFFIFSGTTNALDDDTVAHELHHVLFNRFDAAVDRHFIAFNSPPPTTDPRNAGIALPDPRVDRRIQNLNAPDPDNDPANDNILNWVRRARTARQPAVAGTGPATATTGNTLVEPF